MANEELISAIRSATREEVNVAVNAIEQRLEERLASIETAQKQIQRDISDMSNRIFHLDLSYSLLKIEVTQIKGALEQIKYMVANPNSVLNKINNAAYNTRPNPTNSIE